MKIQTLTLICLWAWSKALSSCNLVAFHVLDWRLICSSRVQFVCMQVWRYIRRSNQLVCAWGKKKNLKCAPAERTRLPDWCLTFLLESPDSLQIFIRAGANKVSRLSRKRGLWSQFDVRSQVRPPVNSNGGEGLKWCEPEEDKRRGVVDRRMQWGRSAVWKQQTRRLLLDKGGRRQIKEEVQAVRN